MSAFSAINILQPPPFASRSAFEKSPPSPVTCKRQVGKVMASHVTNHPPTTGNSSSEQLRRTQTNHRPSVWDYGSIQSLGSHSMGSSNGEQLEKLTQAVSVLFEQAGELRAELQLVDAVQRLGMGYLFEKEIKKVLDRTAERVDGIVMVDDDLYTRALLFRLLRQHGYKVSQDVFKSFRDKEGFKPYLSEEIQGMLSLYEASHLAFEGEIILEEARNFTRNRLRGHLQVEPGLAVKVQHALELPTHRWLTWLEARWYMDSYPNEHWSEPAVVELSRMHFNMVQATHRNDVKAMSSWWKDLALASRLSFARDRLMESFYWSIGLVYEPQFRYCRQQLTKVAQLLTTIDDVYDVYGTLDELELFTDAIRRWDLNTIDHLPDYMKTCFEALFKTVKRIGDDTIKELDRDINPYLSKAWGDLCEAFLTEAKWFDKKTKPTLEEYLENGWVSSSGPLLLTFAYYLLPRKASNKESGSLDNYMDLIKCSSMIFRLCNDLAISKEELELEGGDSISAIQLYMDETGSTEETACEYIRSLISDCWKRLNEESISCFPLSQTFTHVVINLARNAQTVYLHGDGFSAPEGQTKACVTSLLVETY
ncbi:terpene synthase 10-like [Aristolochia californica]|uniref:terpene synthase 10-like n=1 Tax=Aristolochia californica TaxID=171875 RepID=UPI0035E183BE